MIDAQLLIKASSAYSLFSPWFARQGDYVRISGELVANSGSTIQIELFTKNSETVGDGQTVDSETTLALSTVGVPATQEFGPNASSNSAQGILELVRYKITITGGSAGDWAMYRLLAPVWFDAVKA
ncbi:MAG: hypothetical protein IPM29_17145 [Planctomycetes bacterium]|nr:hypothetical protein [Planctomycetota bacterium]